MFSIHLSNILKFVDPKLKISASAAHQCICLSLTKWKYHKIKISRFWYFILLVFVLSFDTLFSSVTADFIEWISFLFDLVHITFVWSLPTMFKKFFRRINMSVGIKLKTPCILLQNLKANFFLTNNFRYRIWFTRLELNPLWEENSGTIWLLHCNFAVYSLNKLVKGGNIYFVDKNFFYNY